MPDLRELLRRRSSDFLRRAFRRDERWKARLQRLGAEPELVVIRIRNFRLVFPIIEAVMALDLLDQAIVLVLRLYKRETLDRTHDAIRLRRFRLRRPHTWLR